MADAPDSKSGDGNIVRVQVPPPAPQRPAFMQAGFYFSKIKAVKRFPASRLFEFPYFSMPTKV